MITFQEIFESYKKCRIGKSYSRQQTYFEIHLSKKIYDLTNELNSKKYKLEPSNFFVISKPKPREIFAAHFKDRIVHHYLVSKLTPIWEKKFSNASFACRKSRGTMAAIEAFRNYAHALSQSGTQNVYILQMDIKLFFSSIHRPTLCELFLKHNPYKELDWLIKKIILHDARKYITKFKQTENDNFKNLIPKEKSWFSKPDDYGIAIGNLTSQFGSNIYLNDFDHYVQRILKPKKYLRYVDDLTFIDTDKNKLESIIQKTKEWLIKYRKIEINDKKTKLSNLKNGVELLGYHIKQINHNEQNSEKKFNKNSTIILLPKSKKWNFIATLKKIDREKILYTKFIHPLSKRRVHVGRSHFNSINSRIGHIKHAKTYLFRKKAIEQLKTDTAVKAFDATTLQTKYWDTIKTKKYRSIKKLARIKMRAT